MKAVNQLIRNTGIYAIGNIGTKVLSYVMVVAYSYFLSKEDMGYYDLVNTTISLVFPLVTFEIIEGVYRYILTDSCVGRKMILSTSFKFILVSILLSTILYGMFCRFFEIPYATLIYFEFVLVILYTYVREVIRGLGRVQLYAITGIAQSILLLVVQIIGFVILHVGIEALFISRIISYAICIFVIVCAENSLVSAVAFDFDVQLLKEMLRYSLPIVPDVICWWTIAASDRYIIRMFLGNSYNGLYAMSNKFPIIVGSFTSIFYIAWQESSIKEYGKSGYNDYYSSVFRFYSEILLMISAFLIPFTHVIVEIVISRNYNEAWLYSGFLYLGVVFNALSSFLGVGYQISKETVKGLYSGILAAFINITLNILLIPYFGLFAASLSTFLAYFVIFIIRIIHTRRYFVISFSWITLIKMLILCLLEIILMIVEKSVIVSIILAIASGICFVYMVRKKGYVQRLFQIVEEKSISQ